MLVRYLILSSSLLDMKKTGLPAAYQLATTDNPCVVIAQVQFNVRTVLRVKKKFGFVDGSVKEPAKEAAEYEDWISAKSMVTLWILNTVDPKVRRTLAIKEDPMELWKEIKDCFSEGNGPRIQEIKAELMLCCQGTMAVIEYFGKLQVLWENMTNNETPLTCTCDGCSCNLKVKLEKKREDDRIHHFLLGLDVTIYGGLRTTIIVYSKVKLVERVNIVMRGREQQASQVAFLALRSDVSVGNTNKSKLVCSSCTRTGHTAETCFQVIGYPEWWGDRSRRGGRGGREAGRGRGSIPRANAVVAQPLHDVSVEAERSGYTGLTNEQWSTLIKFFDEKQGTSTRLNGMSLSLDWVLDTRASGHMT
ncbi:hypothetical protein CARUB_v10015375mg, partial [Capsella rubella]